MSTTATYSISILHLGDIHYPELVQSPMLADVKDKGFSNISVQAITSTRISELVREIERVRTEDNISAIIQTGDLTSKGDAGGYRDCLSFLHDALRFCDTSYWSTRHFIAVPGNHDVDRKSIKADADPHDKFTPLLSQWLDVFGSHQHLTVDAPKASDLTFPGSAVSPTQAVRLIPINTCLMCGEFRAIPEQIRSRVKLLIEAWKKETSLDDFEQVMREQIDCPAVKREHIDTLGGLINQCDDRGVSVVIGHHPIFAQPTTRVDGYSELLNAGYIREVLLNTRRNVVYLHGHIHQTPLLTLSSPLKGTNRIIHISAPAIDGGFHLLRIHFSRLTGQALGLELIPYSFGDHLGLERRDPIRMRLIDQESLWSEMHGPYVDHILASLKTPSNVMRFQDLLDSMPSGHNGDRVSEMRSAIELLELLELVEVTNRAKTVQYWQCQRRVI